MLPVVVMHLPFPFPSCVPVHLPAVAEFPVAGGRRRYNHKPRPDIRRTNIRESAFRVAVSVASFGSPSVLRVVTNPKPAALRMQPNTGPLNLGWWGYRSAGWSQRHRHIGRKSIQPLPTEGCQVLKVLKVVGICVFQNF